MPVESRLKIIYEYEWTKIFKMQLKQYYDSEIVLLFGLVNVACILRKCQGKAIK